MSADLVLRCRAEIDRLRTVEAAATAGPWETDGCEIYQAGTRDWIGETLSDRLTKEQDSEFVVASRSFVPAVLDAFTAILDQHRLTRANCCVLCWDDEADQEEGGEGDSGYFAFPCPTVAAVAAALGVGDQETQP